MNQETNQVEDVEVGVNVFQSYFILLHIYTNLTLIHSVRDPSQKQALKNKINV